MQENDFVYRVLTKFLRVLTFAIFPAIRKNIYVNILPQTDFYSRINIL